MQRNPDSRLCKTTEYIQAEMKLALYDALVFSRSRKGDLDYVGLRELLQSYPAMVGDDGTVEWRGFHYRDYDEEVLRYFPGEPVTIRPSPLAEAAILVYWRGSVLCYAVAEELRHEDGSYRPYWFPYPRLGE